MLDDDHASGAVESSTGRPASQWETLIIDDADATISLGAPLVAAGDGVTSGAVLCDDDRDGLTLAATDLTAIMDATVIESVSGAEAGPGSASFTRGTRFHEAVGRKLHVLDVLGRGGMGVAFRARQQDLARDVAIKVLHGGGSQSAPTEALHREARLTADLDHPGVIPIHQAGCDFFSMRLVRGRTLRSLCGDGPTTGESLVRLVGHLARLTEAVAFAHHRGILHRDIKPGNVMVGEHDEVLLLDWGLALRGELVDGHWRCTDQASYSACAGTPQYLAPETACGRSDDIGPASDVFLLGALLYQFLTGRPPYVGQSVRQVLLAAAINDWTSVAKLVDDAPPDLVALQEAAMASEPGARPDAAALGAGLRAWLHGRSVARRATEALAAARQVVAALPPPEAAADVMAVYADCDRARRHTQAAEALIGATQEVIMALVAIELAQARQALETGDLGLARVCIDRVQASDDHPPVAAMRAALAQCEARRHAARRGLRILAVAAVLLVGIGLASLIISTRYALDGEARLVAERQGQAQDMFELAHAMSADDLAGRQLLLHQALGYDETHAGVRSLLADTTQALAWQSVENGDVGSARHLAVTVADLGQATMAQELMAAIDAAVAARDAIRREEVARRHALLERIDGAAEEALAIDDALAVQIAAWDGTEHLPALSALLVHPRPAVRLLVVQVLARRKSWDDGQRLLAAGADADRAVRLAAWRTFGRHDYGVPTEVIVRALAARDDEPETLPGSESRQHAALLGPRQRRALAQAGRGAAEAGRHRAALRQLLWADESMAVVDLVTAHLSDDHEAMALAARLAWWRLHDPDRAAILAEALRQLAPRAWDGWHVAWCVYLARGDTAALRASVRSASAHLGDDPRLIAWRAAIGEAAAERALAQRLATAESGFGPALSLALRVALERPDQAARLRHARDRLRLTTTATDGWLVALNEVHQQLWLGHRHRALRLVALLAEAQPEQDLILQLHQRVLAIVPPDTATLFAAHATALVGLVSGEEGL